MFEELLKLLSGGKETPAAAPPSAPTGPPPANLQEIIQMLSKRQHAMAPPEKPRSAAGLFGDGKVRDFLGKIAAGAAGGRPGEGVASALARGFSGSFGRGSEMDKERRKEYDEADDRQFKRWGDIGDLHLKGGADARAGNEDRRQDEELGLRRRQTDADIKYKEALGSAAAKRTARDRRVSGTLTPSEYLNVQKAASEKAKELGFGDYREGAWTDEERAAKLKELNDYRMKLLDDVTRLKREGAYDPSEAEPAERSEETETDAPMSGGFESAPAAPAAPVAPPTLDTPTPKIGPRPPPAAPGRPRDPGAVREVPNPFAPGSPPMPAAPVPLPPSGTPLPAPPTPTPLPVVPVPREGRVPKLELPPQAPPRPPMRDPDSRSLPPMPPRQPLPTAQQKPKGAAQGAAFKPMRMTDPETGETVEFDPKTNSWRVVKGP